MSKQAILAIPLVIPLLMFQWNLCTPNSKGSAHNVNPRLAYFTSASAAVANQQDIKDTRSRETPKNPKRAVVYETGGQDTVWSITEDEPEAMDRDEDHRQKQENNEGTSC
ncbi:hypothetical protein BDR06DRAFT_1000088 [Suillus hirtellus]|nr:hypothetical protein BDR06DRAFT_1000088 [Suillus hirtellus]